MSPLSYEEVKEDKHNRTVTNCTLQGISKMWAPGCVRLGEKVAFCAAGR